MKNVQMFFIVIISFYNCTLISHANSVCSEKYNIDDAKIEVYEYLNKFSYRMRHFYKIKNLKNQVSNLHITSRKMGAHQEWHIKFDFDNGCGELSAQKWIKIQCEPQLAIPGNFGRCL